MPKVEVNDIEMHYEVHGEGEPVVFLHVFSATNQMWEPFIPVSITVTMYDSIPDSYLWIIPNMGHGVAWPPAEGLIRTTFDFLRRDWGPP
jgi:pimeloyl-ACP methyl ester carboxylesterase